MRVLDPTGVCANDTDCFPDDIGGVYQVDAGSSGGGVKNTVVQVQITGKSINFRVLQAENGLDESFTLKDQWEITE